VLPSLRPKGDSVYEGGEWYSGGGVSFDSMTDFLGTLDDSFRDELGTKERHEFDTAKQVDELLESWPWFIESHPDEADAIKDWFTTIAKEEVLQSDDDAYIGVVQLWYDMVKYLRQPEGDNPFIPTGSDGNELGGLEAPPAYKDFEFIDGDIYHINYVPTAYYCTDDGSDVDGPSDPNFVRECSTTPAYRGEAPDYYEYKQVYSNITGKDEEFKAFPSDLEGAYV